MTDRLEKKHSAKALESLFEVFFVFINQLNCWLLAGFGIEYVRVYISPDPRSQLMADGYSLRHAIAALNRFCWIFGLNVRRSNYCRSQQTVCAEN